MNVRHAVKDRALFAAAGVLACVAGVALAQTAAPVVPPAPSEPAVQPPAPVPAISGPAEVAAPAPVAAAAAPVAPEPAVSDAPAKAALKAGSDASAAGDIPGAVAAWRQAVELAPPGEAGERIVADAARRLGFAAYELRNPRGAEPFFAAEAVLMRRMYFSGRASARAFSDAVGRWASATGLMGRSNESAALVFYAQEIKARAQAAASAEALNRDAESPADQIGPVRVNVGEFCATGREPLLKDRVSCEDEAGARSEALSLQARQIRASAPPPPSKEEREAKAAKAKKGG